MHGGSGWVPLGDVAKRQNISQKYLWQLANALRSAGIIRVLRGPRGGFALARSPEAITLCDILGALEGDFLLFGDAKAVVRNARDVTGEVWKDLEQKLREAMEAINVQQMIDRQRAKEDNPVLDWMI